MQEGALGTLGGPGGRHPDPVKARLQLFRMWAQCEQRACSCSVDPATPGERCCLRWGLLVSWTPRGFTKRLLLPTPLTRRRCCHRVCRAGDPGQVPAPSSLLLSKRQPVPAPGAAGKVPCWSRAPAPGPGPQLLARAGPRQPPGSMVPNSRWAGRAGPHTFVPNDQFPLVQLKKGQERESTKVHGPTALRGERNRTRGGKTRGPQAPPALAPPQPRGWSFHCPISWISRVRPRGQPHTSRRQQGPQGGWAGVRWLPSAHHLPGPRPCSPLWLSHCCTFLGVRHNSPKLVTREALCTQVRISSLPERRFQGPNPCA